MDILELEGECLTVGEDLGKIWLFDGDCRHSREFVGILGRVWDTGHSSQSMGM